MDRNRFDLSHPCGSSFDTCITAPALDDLPLVRIADVGALCITRLDTPVIDRPRLHELDFEGCAILFRTGHSATWGTAGYEAAGYPHISVATAASLVRAQVGCVGIDTPSIGPTAAPDCEVRAALLDAGISIIENLAHLDAIPQYGFRFTAVPPLCNGTRAPVRAFASVLKHRPDAQKHES